MSYLPSLCLVTLFEITLPAKDLTAILERWQATARAWLPPELRPSPFPTVAPGSRISAALAAWAEAAPRPLVVFLDEIDALRDEVLMSVLRQLRDGYRDRPGHFPASLALIGLRDVRDYKVASAERGTMGTASPFNIKVRSLTLRHFTAEEVAELYAQHTEDTGQRFEPEAVALAFELTQGQPWLINALAKVAVEERVPDPSQPVRREEIGTPGGTLRWMTRLMASRSTGSIRSTTRTSSRCSRTPRRAASMTSRTCRPAARGSASRSSPCCCTPGSRAS
jgi:hypothetical protein